MLIKLMYRTRQIWDLALFLRHKKARTNEVKGFFQGNK